MGERIAELSSRIQAATYELLVLIREFDADIGWSGWNSASQWLSWRTGLAPGAAREHVRVAHALENLPKLSDAMRRGRVSYSKVRAVTRVATPETEQTLLDVALSGTAAHVEQIVRGWRRVDRNAERSEEKLRQDKRSLRTWVAEDGMVVVKGRLTPEVGAAFRRALEAACDQAYARRSVDGSDDAASGGVADELMPDIAAAEEELAPTLAQRQADAVGVIAECALAGGLDKGTAGDRYQVVVHVDAAALEDEADVPAGTYESAEPAAELDDAEQGVPAGTSGSDSSPAMQSQTVLEEAGGIHVSAETARRLACDAAKVEMQHGREGEILGVGRRTRTISPALRRALAARDGQCRFLRAVRTGAPMLTMSSTGRTAGRRCSTTWCCCAGGITGRCTRAASASRWMRRARLSSCGPTAGRSRRLLRCRCGAARRSGQPTPSSNRTA